MHNTEKITKNRGSAILIAVGMVFIFSAVAKLDGLNLFEIRLLSDGLLPSRTLAALAARLLIALELVLGIGLCQAVWRRRVLVPATLILLLIFNVYLFYAVFFRGDVENCGCFGEVLKMSPAQALIKNILLMALLAWGWKLHPADRSRPRWQVPALAAMALLLVFLGFPMKNARLKPVGAKKNPVVTSTVSPFARLTEFNTGTIDVTHGRCLLAFLSVDCEHCRAMAAQLRELSENKILPPVYLILLGDQADIPPFLTETGVSFPYTHPKADVFFEFVDDVPPYLYLLQDGRILAKWNQDRFTPDVLLRALAQ